MEREQQAGLEVVRRLTQLGHVAYYAGGCVRDQLLGRPASDVDVATSARPEQVQAAFRRTLPMGVQFGIVVVRQRGVSIEVATFRTDGDYHDGRRPESVRFTDAAEDACRRDFTINGLFFDPLREEVHDFVGGQDDLRRGVVRAIGDPEQRFEEDKLRVLRAPRFAATLGFTIDPATAVAARRQAPQIEVVAQERIHTELAKLLDKPTRARGLALCEDLGLLEHVLPEARVDLPRVLRALDALDPGAPLTTVWAALLHLVPPRAAEAALRRLRASNKEIQRVVALLEALSQTPQLPRQPLAAQKRALVGPEWAELPELLRATALGGEGDLEPLRFLQARAAAFAAEEGPASLTAPPLLRGADLQQAGIQPGPRFGQLLRQVGDAQLEGRVATREEALALALELADRA